MFKYNEKISVIVPCYNVENYLHNTMKSILSQTYDNLEIILIDDGSTDNTGKIIDDFEKTDPRIKAIHQGNVGLSATRNKGIRVSTGIYISFIDADDYIDDTFYERLYTNLITYGADLAICGTKCFKNGKLDALLPPYRSKMTDKLDEKINLLRGGGVCDKLYKASILKDNCIFFEEGRMYEGNSFLVEYCYFTDKVVFSPDTFYNYVIHENSITTNSDIQHLIKLRKDRLHFIKVLNNFSKSHRIGKKSRDAVLRLIGRSILDKDDIRLLTLFRYLGLGLLTAKGEKWVIKKIFSLKI